MSGVGTAIGIGAAVSAAGALGGAAISSNAAGNAASTQANAATQAAQLQYQASQNALGFQEGEYNNSQQELAPYLQSGTQALGNLNYLLGNGQQASPTAAQVTGLPANGSPQVQTNAQTPNGAIQSTAPGGSAIPGGTAPGLTPPPTLTSTPNTNLGASGSLLAPYPGGQFSAPTAAQAEQTPGYQFQLQQGNQALQQSAAARGNLLTGGTAEALDNYSQGLAASNYQNTYNNAYNTYASNYNQYQNQQANTYNRLASLAGVGQTAAGQLGTLGQNAANSVSSNLLGTAAQQGQDYQNAAAANASGLVGSANAINGGISSATGSLSQLSILQQLLNGGGGGSPISPGFGDYTSSPDQG